MVNHVTPLQQRSKNKCIPKACYLNTFLYTYTTVQFDGRSDPILERGEHAKE